MSDDTLLPVLGTCVHGFFDDDQARRAVINWLAGKRGLLRRRQAFPTSDFARSSSINLRLWCGKTAILSG